MPDDVKEPKSIFHSGVLGMKWGVRKRAASRPSSADHGILKEIKGKQVHELSNAQIRKAAERIQLEKQFKDATTKQQSTGSRIVKEVLAAQGKVLATTIVAGATTKAVKYVIDNKETIIDSAVNMIKIVPKGVG